MAVTQKPLAAWHLARPQRPPRGGPRPPGSSWQNDNVINPDLERFFAKRMGATTTEITSSHAVFMSHAKEVAAVIESAARAATTSIARTQQ
jgi:hypothetical protein